MTKTVWVLMVNDHFKGLFATADLAKESRQGLHWALYGGRKWVAHFSKAGPGEAMIIEEHEIEQGKEHDNNAVTGGIEQEEQARLLQHQRSDERQPWQDERQPWEDHADH